MSKKFKAIIVDDERLARKELTSLLEEFPVIDVVGEADDTNSAHQIIEKLKPDVVFLDIQMPGESGFDLVNKLKHQTKIIFVTAFDEYAIRAFEINALDYLLKPINPERLAASIERLTSETEEDSELTRDLDFDDRLFLSINNEMKFLRVSDIICISAAGDYSELKIRDGKKGLVLKSMREWENRLPERYFCRIHRSTIINMEYIDKIEEWFNHSYRVYLKSIEDPFVMSRRYVSKLKDKFK